MIKEKSKLLEIIINKVKSTIENDFAAFLRDDNFYDYWNSITIDDAIYDFNVWKDESADDNGYIDNISVYVVWNDGGDLFVDTTKVLFKSTNERLFKIDKSIMDSTSIELVCIKPFSESIVQKVDLDTHYSHLEYCNDVAIDDAIQCKESNNAVDKLKRWICTKICN